MDNNDAMSLDEAGGRDTIQTKARGSTSKWNESIIGFFSGEPTTIDAKTILKRRYVNEEEASGPSLPTPPTTYPPPLRRNLGHYESKDSFREDSPASYHASALIEKQHEAEAQNRESLSTSGHVETMTPRSPSQRKHKCPYCATEFTRYHNLKSHLLTHSQEKPYVCQTCNERFRRLHDLKRHMKLHTGERLHVCPECDRKFARGDALARHCKGKGGCNGRRSTMGDFEGDEEEQEDRYTTSFTLDAQQASGAQQPSKIDPLKGLAFKIETRVTSSKPTTAVHNSASKSLKWEGSLTDNSIHDFVIIEDPEILLWNNITASKQKITHDSEATDSTELTIPDFGDEDDGNLSNISSDDPDLQENASPRILNPSKYFAGLEALQKEVYDECGYLFASTNNGTLLMSYADDFCFHKKIDFDVLKVVRLSASTRLLYLLECYSTMRQVGKCLSKLQNAGYCTSKVIFLALDSRPNVAKASSIRIEDIFRVGSHFESALNGVISELLLLPLGGVTEDVVDGVVEEWAGVEKLSADCEDILTWMNLLPEASYQHHHKCPIVWSCAVQTLQLGILSYAGAHLQSLDFIAVSVESYTLPLELSYDEKVLESIRRRKCGSKPCLEYWDSKSLANAALDRSSKPQAIPGYQAARFSHRPFIQLQRREFQCLDVLLGHVQPWVFHTASSLRLAEVSVRAVPRPAKMLSGAHGSENESSYDDSEAYKVFIALHLLTGAGSLADLWGPCWKVLAKADSSDEVIERYDIGNGSIICWPSAGTQIEVRQGEVYCHWLSAKDWNDEEIATTQKSLERKYFLKSDILLIGASTEYGLHVNKECSAYQQISRIKSLLDDQGALRAPKTYRAKRYVDSQAVQVGATAFGVLSGTGIITYKRRAGHSMKDALIERWRHNLRSPLDLEAFSGVEVSICTKNARRQRLMHLLASPTMSNYLRTISFSWESETCENAYFKALRSPKSLRRLWKEHKEWRSNVGDAITTCLDALEETGIDDDSGELSALWVEAFDQDGESDGESDDEPEETSKAADQSSTASFSNVADFTSGSSQFCEEHIVTLFRSEHTWTGFLRDSEESLTMAILSMNCLDYLDCLYGYGRQCARKSIQTALENRNEKGFPVLQTSLKINESLLNRIALRKQPVEDGRKTVWDARELKPGTSFGLGDHGSLKIVNNSNRSCPAIAEWSAVKSEKVREFRNVAINERLLGRNSSRHHTEHIRGSWEVKPLPVLVMSKSTKVLFSKDKGKSVDRSL